MGKRDLAEFESPDESHLELDSRPQARQLLYAYQLKPTNQTRIDLVEGPQWADVVPARILRRSELVQLFESFVALGFAVHLDSDGFPVVHKGDEAYKFVRGRRPTGTSIGSRGLNRGLEPLSNTVPLAGSLQHPTNPQIRHPLRNDLFRRSLGGASAENLDDQDEEAHDESKTASGKYPTNYDFGLSQADVSPVLKGCCVMDSDSSMSCHTDDLDSPVDEIEMVKNYRRQKDKRGREIVQTTRQLLTMKSRRKSRRRQRPERLQIQKSGMENAQPTDLYNNLMQAINKLSKREQRAEDQRDKIKRFLKLKRLKGYFESCGQNRRTFDESDSGKLSILKSSSEEHGEFLPIPDENCDDDMSKDIMNPDAFRYKAASDEFSWKMEAGLKALCDLKRRLEEIADQRLHYPEFSSPSSTKKSCRETSSPVKSPTDIRPRVIAGDDDAAVKNNQDKPESHSGRTNKDKKSTKQAGQVPIELVCNLSLLFKYEKKYLKQLNDCLAKMNIAPIESEAVDMFLRQMADPKSPKDLKIRGKIEVWPDLWPEELNSQPTGEKSGKVFSKNTHSKQPSKRPSPKQSSPKCPESDLNKVNTNEGTPASSKLKLNDCCPQLQVPRHIEMPFRTPRAEIFSKAGSDEPVVAMMAPEVNMAAASDRNISNKQFVFGATEQGDDNQRATEALYLTSNFGRCSRRTSGIASRDSPCQLKSSKSDDKLLETGEIPAAEPKRSKVRQLDFFESGTGLENGEEVGMTCYSPSAAAKKDAMKYLQPSPRISASKHQNRQKTVLVDKSQPSGTMDCITRDFLESHSDEISSRTSFPSSLTQSNHSADDGLRLTFKNSQTKRNNNKPQQNHRNAERAKDTVSGTNQQDSKDGTQNISAAAAVATTTDEDAVERKIKLSKRDNLIVMCGGDIIFDVRNAKNKFLITLYSKSGPRKFVSHNICIDKKAGKVGVDCSVREGKSGNPFLPTSDAEPSAENVAVE